jgi:hypothetical protein
MPAYPVFSITDKGSSAAATASAVFTRENALLSLPDKVGGIALRRRVLVAFNVTSGATAVDASIGRVQFQRVGLLPNSLCTVKYSWSFYSPVVPANSCAGEGAFSVYSNNNTLTLLANSVQTKMPSAATATVVPTVYNTMVGVVLTGNAGDTTGYWTVIYELNDVTDIG